MPLTLLIYWTNGRATRCIELASNRKLLRLNPVVVVMRFRGSISPIRLVALSSYAIHTSNLV